MTEKKNLKTNIDISVITYIYIINNAIYINRKEGQNYYYIHLFIYEESNNDKIQILIILFLLSSFSYIS